MYVISSVYSIIKMFFLGLLLCLFPLGFVFILAPLFIFKIVALGLLLAFVIFVFFSDKYILASFHSHPIYSRRSQREVSHEGFYFSGLHAIEPPHFYAAQENLGNFLIVTNLKGRVNILIDEALFNEFSHDERRAVISFLFSMNEITDLRTRTFYSAVKLFNFSTISFINKCEKKIFRSKYFGLSEVLQYVYKVWFYFFESIFFPFEKILKIDNQMLISDSFVSALLKVQQQFENPEIKSGSVNAISFYQNNVIGERFLFDGAQAFAEQRVENSQGKGYLSNILFPSR